MKILLLLLSILTTVTAGGSFPADSTKLTLSKAEQIISRPMLKPVESFKPDAAAKSVIDTLDTASPFMKIILYSDNTWEYKKDGDEISSTEVFTEHWNNVNADPYRIEFENMPWKAYVTLVDSVSHYSFPGHMTTVTSRYGRRHGRFHRGIDLRYARGDSIVATFDGKVRIAKYVSGYGNLVVLRHENGLETFYGHLSKVLVNEGDWVSCAEPIGLAGNTGRSTGPHLHYEVRYLGYAIDPEWMIDFESGMLRHGVLVVKKKQLLPDCRFAPESDLEEDEIAAADEADRLEAERIAAEMKAAKYYKIRSGDTLSGIAHRYGTTVSAICKLNGITPKTTLRVGRTIRVR